MASKKIISSRRLACEVLDKLDLKRHDLSDRLHAALYKTDHPAHTTDLVYGSIRHKGTLDYLIEMLCELPIKRIEKRLINLLRLSVYEIIYAPSTPEYAILNEAVELAGKKCGKKQKNFLNALLRKFQAAIERRTVSLETCDPLRTLPTAPETGCLFKTSIFTDQHLQSSNYYSIAFSLPVWLVHQWIQDYGIDKTKEICFACNRKPGIYAWPNTIITTPKSLAEKLIQSGCDCEVIDKIGAVKLTSHAAVETLTPYKEGEFLIQDPAANAIIKQAAPQAGQLILDLCAAPGTKACQAVLLMQDKGNLIATDIDSQRLKKIEQNKTRLKLHALTIIHYDQVKDFLKENKLHPDLILLDVPCSNTGVLARRSEVRYRLNQTALDSIMTVQFELLEYAGRLLQPHAKLVYSTCSICKDENTNMIQKFLNKHTDFGMEFESLHLPQTGSNSHDSDGGYVAVLSKH